MNIINLLNQIKEDEVVLPGIQRDFVWSEDKIVKLLDSIMRGLKTAESAQVIVDSMRNYYNFIRPHQSLDGKTPVEEANINLESGNNKWKSIIKIATNR